MNLARRLQGDLFEGVMDGAVPVLPASVLTNEVLPLVQAFLSEIVMAETLSMPVIGKSEVAE